MTKGNNQIRVADYIAEFVREQGVEDVFMLSGGGSIYLDDGIAKNDNLNPVCVRNEATAPMMAEAYARLSGKIGIAYVTTGPGGTNAVTGVAEAWVDSAPILVISGQVQREHTTFNAKVKGLRTLGIQELNIVEIVDSITKYSAMVNDPNNIRYHLEKAVYLARSGRPGPVWLDIPLDVQSAIVNRDDLRRFIPPEEEKGERKIEEDIKEIINLLEESERPLVIAGQGIRIAGAIGDFKKFINELNIPVVSSRLGQDIIPFSCKNNLGHGGSKGSKATNLAMKKSDLVISLGSRLSVPFIKGKEGLFLDNPKLVVVDIDESELKKPGIKIDFPIKSDLKKFLSKLLKELERKKLPGYKNWLEECLKYKENYSFSCSDYRKNPIDLYYFLSRLDDLSNENNIFISDAGSNYYVAGQVLMFEKGQREITSGAFASMGLSIPLAIGSAIAEKEKQILAVTGDGSLELNIQELKTMSCYNLDIKLFVINNGGYVSIRNTQDSLFKGRYINSNQGAANEILDLKKVAQAFDLPYFIIKRCEEIDGKISEILDKRGPAFVEVVCDNNQKIIGF
mgnify:CR=1 FL=1